MNKAGTVAALAAVAGATWVLLGSRAPRPAGTLTGRVTRTSAKVAGRRRRWLVYRPASYAAGAPVLLVLHGSGETGTTFRRATGRRFDELADRQGFIVVYPDGWRRNWNETRLAGRFAAKKKHIDDTRFLTELADSVAGTGAPVWITGFSSGAAAALRVALEASDRIEAIAPVGASVPTADNWQTDLEVPATLARRVRALLVLGDRDPVNPLNGGRAGLFDGKVGNRGSVLSGVDSTAWLATHDFDAILHVVQGNGHHYTVPGRRGPRLFGPTASGVDIAADVVAYFRGDASPRQ